MIDVEKIFEYLKESEEALASEDLEDDEKVRLLAVLECAIELLEESLELPGGADLRDSIIDLLAIAKQCYDRNKS